MAWTTPKTWSAGETLTAANFNAQIRDNQLSMAEHLIAKTASDVSRTSTSVANDATLFTPSIPANEVWQLKWILNFNTSTSDPIVAVTFPSGDFSGTINGVQNTYSLSSTTSPTPTRAPDANNIDPGYLCILYAVFRNGVTPGAVTLQWGSNTGPAVILNAHSTLWGVKLA